MRDKRGVNKPRRVALFKVLCSKKILSFTIILFFVINILNSVAII